MAKPLLPKDEMFRMIHRVGSVVLDQGGIITTLKSFGNQTLAQDIRKTPYKYSQAHMWQMDFVLGPEALRDVNHELRVNEEVLRWIVLKRKDTAGTPNPRTLFWKHPEHGGVLRPGPSNDA